MEFFLFMQGFLSSRTLGFYYTENNASNNLIIHVPPTMFICKMKAYLVI